MSRPRAMLAGPVLRWYATAARDLPWRRPGTSPWAVLVSEIMLQQTPVARVLPAYEAWIARWPAPAALAADAAGEAVRQWGGLGYPRRALRLHTTASVIVDRHESRVPAAYDDLAALPGVGAYTAAAVASFAFGQRHAVLDTNVRRVLARAIGGHAAAGPTPTSAERRRAEALVPVDPPTAARYAAAVMELGALVCTARTPHCEACPLAPCCAWRRAGHPPPAAPAVRSQSYEGTDRQARGRLLAVLRAAKRPVGNAALLGAWPARDQGHRALAGLVADGLAERLPGGEYALPGTCTEGPAG